MFKALGSYIDNIVKILLVANVFSMLLLSVSSIVLRWFGISFIWIEPLVRHMVFITAFLGAVLATSSGRHISIEILGKYLESSKHVKLQLVLKKAITAFTSCALIWFSYSGYTFFLMEKEYGKITSLGLHTSTLVAIIPIGFLLIFLRSICILFDFSSDKEEVL